VAERGFTPNQYIVGEISSPADDERAEQDRYVAGRADIWNTARNMLHNSGDLNAEPGDVLDLARFLAGDPAP
jgi:hypothetical protein